MENEIAEEYKQEKLKLKKLILNLILFVV